MATWTRRNQYGTYTRIDPPISPIGDMYFFLIEGSWTKLVLGVSFLYVLINVFFALLYMAGGECIAGVQPSHFFENFYFSVQTISTIGYGAMAPTTPYAHAVVTVESLAGLLGFAVAAGLFFAKFAIPKSNVVFSQKAVICTWNGKRALMLRLGNARGNELVECVARIRALVRVTSPEGFTLVRSISIPLENDNSAMMAMAWVLIHVIDEHSPLYGFDPNDSQPSVTSLMVTMTGHDASYGQTVHAHHIYRPSEIQPGHRLVDVIEADMEAGRYVVDYRKFHTTVPDEHGVEA